MNVQLLGQTVDRVDSEDVDAGVRPDVAVGLGEYDRAMNRSVGALAVIGLEITNVPGGLVDVGSIGVSSTLELQNQDGSAHEKHDVGASELEWKFVFEDRGVVGRQRVVEQNLADLPLQRRDGQIPGTDLFRRHVAEEVLQGAPDPEGRRGLELWKRGRLAMPSFFSYRIPRVAGHRKPG